MKRIISLCISVCLIISTGSISSQAEEITDLILYNADEESFVNDIESVTDNTQVENTGTASFIVNVNDGTAVATEEDTNGKIDNSNLEVNVIKVVGDAENTIYTGSLGGYDNGAWKNTDFSKISFFVIVDWESMEHSC